MIFIRVIKKYSNTGSYFFKSIIPLKLGTWKLNESKHNFEEAIWAFERNTGGIIFNIKTTPTNVSENIDFLFGYVEIRDGVYSTDEYLRYHILGKISLLQRFRGIN